MTFLIAFAKILAAYIAARSLFEPVSTTLPDEKTIAVVFGSLILMTTALNLFGLYSALRHHYEILSKSS